MCSNCMYLCSITAAKHEHTAELISTLINFSLLQLLEICDKYLNQIFHWLMLFTKFHGNKSVIKAFALRKVQTKLVDSFIELLIQ